MPGEGLVIYHVIWHSTSKFLADAGVASPGAAEQIILAGRVSVNGQLVRLLGTRVDPIHDEVTVDGRRPRQTQALRGPAQAGRCFCRPG